MCPALLYGCVLAGATGAAHAAAREPHIALVLPLASASFGRHADAVRQGFLAAAKLAPKTASPVRVYTADEDGMNVLTVYEQALESGAQLVVGPLTRAGTAALAASAAADDGRSAKSVPRDSAGYFDRASDRDHHLRDDIVRHLEAMGIDVEASHHEVAPVNGLSGSGMHVHQGLRGPDGEDLFHDPSQPYGLSKIAQHFIAGQLRHAKALSAVLAPLVNSYKRLVPGYEAPVHITWARANRSALIRVPESAPGSATRVELRLPDASCNPYLAFAVMLGAGLDGIDQELPLPEPVEEHPQLLFDPARQHRFNVGMLPTSLADAVRELEDDAVIAGILGPHILERMVETQRMDWENYRVQVTPWELKRYLPGY